MTRYIEERRDAFGVGASRERVNKALAKWRENGLIEIGASGIRVLDRLPLAQLAKASTRR